MSINTKKKDQGFTNIRIREETREELRVIGSYGENMDDIVRKCLEAYKSIISSGGRVVNKIVIEEPIKEQAQIQQQYQQSQSQPQQQPSELQKFYKSIPKSNRQIQEDIKNDTYEPSVDEMLDSSFGMILPEIKFPKNKKELIQFVKDFQNEFRIKYHKVPLVTEQALTVMENLPNLNITYKNLKQLSDHLERAVYNENVQKKLLNKGIRIRDVAIGVLDTERKKNAVMKKMVESDDGFRRRFKEQQGIET